MSKASVEQVSAGPGHRLTLTTSVPATTSDVTAATTIYHKAHKHQNAQTWDGTPGEWTNHTYDQISLALGTLADASNSDVFLYKAATGAPTLELSAVWTNDTTRADALGVRDGVIVKSSDHTRTYLGTIRTTATTTTEDSAAKRFVWNQYNRVGRNLAAAKETADSWTYATATWRQANANAANQLMFVTGQIDQQVSAEVKTGIKIDATSGTYQAGIGLDSTTVPQLSSGRTGTVAAPVALLTSGPAATFFGTAGAVGYHYVAWLEKTVAAAGGNATVIVYGDNADATTYQWGINGYLHS